jgi:hypothetical protein
MDEVRGILERVLQDGIFREYCFVACHGAEADCHDRVQSLFDDLRLQMNNPARQENATVAAVVDFQRGLVASMLIDDYVFNIHAEHAQLRAQLPPELQAQLPLELLINYHALESAQLLRKELWKALKLPIPFKDIAHPRVALVNLDIKRHKNAALAYVLTNLTPERLSKQMAEDSSCNEFLRTQYPATFAAHSLLWVDAIDKLALKETRFKVDEENKRLTDHVNRTIKLTAEESLEAAHGLPHQGEGYLFKALKKSADEALFTVVSLHACVERTPEERTQWALNNLITNPQWLVYLQSWILKKKPDEEPDGNQVIWPAKPEEAPNQLIEWTKQVLLAEDQLVV